jgi:hypothetical protein
MSPNRDVLELWRRLRQESLFVSSERESLGKLHNDLKEDHYKLLQQLYRTRRLQSNHYVAETGGDLGECFSIDNRESWKLETKYSSIFGQFPKIGQLICKSNFQLLEKAANRKIHRNAVPRSRNDRAIFEKLERQSNSRCCLSRLRRKNAARICDWLQFAPRNCRLVALRTIVCYSESFRAARIYPVSDAPPNRSHKSPAGCAKTRRFHHYLPVARGSSARIATVSDCSALSTDCASSTRRRTVARD